MQNEEFDVKTKLRKFYITKSYKPERRIERTYDIDVKHVPIGNQSFMEMVVTCNIKNKNGQMEVTVEASGQTEENKLDLRHAVLILKTCFIIIGNVFERETKKRFNINAALPMPSDIELAEMIKNRPQNPNK